MSNPKKPCGVCLRCGTTVRWHKRRYCSRDCANKDRFGRSDEEITERKRLNKLLTTRRYQARKYGQLLDRETAKEIRIIYEKCPNGCEVDHIVPLSKGGMHHPSNLQYLTMAENRRKSHKMRL